MTIARVHLVDPLVSRWYHCITRCVRRAKLLGEKQDRKEWIENRLKELADLLGVGVAGVAVLDNHLHSCWISGWTPRRSRTGVGRGGDSAAGLELLFPPRDKLRRPLEASDDWVKGHLLNAAWIKRARERLASLSWFMKCLKEPLARLANQEDQVRGAFFEGRFKSIAILDEESLLATCAYIDLNPLAAGMAPVPESSDHTSIKQAASITWRAQGRTEDLKGACTSSAVASEAGGGGNLEEKHWLCPVEDRRRIDSTRGRDDRGVLAGQLPAAVSRLHGSAVPERGKATLSREMAAILDRLHISRRVVAEARARLRLRHGTSPGPLLRGHLGARTSAKSARGSISSTCATWAAVR